MGQAGAGRGEEGRLTDTLGGDWGVRATHTEGRRVTWCVGQTARVSR